ATFERVAFARSTRAAPVEAPTDGPRWDLRQTPAAEPAAAATPAPVAPPPVLAPPAPSTAGPALAVGGTFAAKVAPATAGRPARGPAASTGGDAPESDANATMFFDGDAADAEPSAAPRADAAATQETGAPFEPPPEEDHAGGTVFFMDEVGERPDDAHATIV